ncbi:MAG: cation transporter [Gammaproteobacteria bacterium]
MGHNHAHTPAGKNKRRLTIVFGLTALYLVAEVIGGVLTGSLALLADAGHMLTDVAGLGLALFAIRFAERPATAERTWRFGSQPKQASSELWLPVSV